MFEFVAILENLATGAQSTLAARHIIGRSKTGHSCIDTPSVSGLHAEIVWNGMSWEIKDLGSRNGTFVDGRRLAVGEHAPLIAGVELGFGSCNNQFRFIEDSPPRLMAISSDGEVCLAEDELLILPSVDVAEVTIFRNADERWIVETSEATRLIADQESIVAGGAAWKVCLPDLYGRTRDATSIREASLSDSQLEFFVSRAEEYVTMKVVHSNDASELEARAHLFLLLALARARLEDAAQPHLPAIEHGWVYRQDVAEMLRIDPQLLNLWIYRARKQLAELGLRGAANIIERRSPTQQIRIGVERLIVHEADNE